MTETALIAGAGPRGSAVRRVAASLRLDRPHRRCRRRAACSLRAAGALEGACWRASAPTSRLRPDSFWAEQEIDLLLGRRVVDVDARRRTALVGDELVAWDAFVHATGVAARRLPGPTGVHHLRSLDDAHALAADADALEPRRRGRRRLHRRRGRLDARAARVGSVTVVEPAAAPLERVLGPRGRRSARRPLRRVRRRPAARHRRRGVRRRRPRSARSG